MSAPYYADDAVTLWHGDCREVLPTLDEQPVAVVADPPYVETANAWDVWPEGWVAAVGAILPASASLWCFGSTRMFLDRRDDFAGWRYGQDQLWVKRNGSGQGSRDRLSRVHEWAIHWYRGTWGDLHHEWERWRAYTDKGTVRRAANGAAHRRPDRASAWTDDGTRQPRTVAHVVESPSVRYAQRHPDEKPLAAVLPLVRECTPGGGLVLDPFAGSGTTGVAARILGRRAVLIEADEAMCEIAATRLSEAHEVLPEPRLAATARAVALDLWGGAS